MTVNERLLIFIIAVKLMFISTDSTGLGTKVMEFMIFGLLLQMYQREQTKYSNAINSDVYGLIGFKFYVRHPGVGLYHKYGNFHFWYVIIDISDI